MDHVLIIHAVQDYEAWKKVFRYDNDPNKVVHFSRWDSIARAKAFFESPQLVEIRQQAGVESPEFIDLHPLETGTL